MIKNKAKKNNLICIAIYTVLILLVYFTCIYIRNKAEIISNWNFTDEQIMEYGPFWITVPALENKGLPTDVNGISFEDEPDTIYLYFPEYVNKNKVVYYIRDGYESQYEARRVADFSNGEIEIAGKKIKLISTEFPMMFIETDDNNMPFSEFVHTDDMTAICSGKIFFDEIKPYEKMYLKPRGNSTWGGMHKKPFSLVMENSYNLMGLGNHKSWNLLADAWDKSLLKNYTFNSLAKDMGIEYEPNMGHVLLYIDGNLQGMYLLTEKVAKVGNGDGKIPLRDDDMLFLWNGVHYEQPVYYDSKIEDDTYADIIYPENIASNELKNKRDIIQRYIDCVENEKSEELPNLLDFDSFMKFYWVEELSMNHDAYSRSIYTIYKNETNKMYYCPIWDMDLTLGANVDGIICESVKGWKVRTKGFYKQLFEHENFDKMAKDFYINEGIHDKFINCINTYVDERDKILKYGELDYKIWKDEYIGDGGLEKSDTYYDYSEQVLNLLVDRIEWIDDEINNNK